VDNLDGGEHFQSAMQVVEDDDGTTDPDSLRESPNRRLETSIVDGRTGIDKEGTDLDDRGDSEALPPPRECDDCSEGDALKHTCTYCGDSYCPAHRLPEKHDCIAVQAQQVGEHFESAIQVKQQSGDEQVLGIADDEDSSDRLETSVVDDRTPVDPSETTADIDSNPDEPPPPSDCPDCDEPDGFTYSCSYCGEQFCPQHRLPEKHDCLAVRAQQVDKRFESGGSDSTAPMREERVREKETSTFDRKVSDREDSVSSDDSNDASVQSANPVPPSYTHGDSSPDVAPDGSIAGQETERIEPDTVPEQEAESGWGLLRVVVLIVLSVIVTVIVFGSV